jgi:hypothetical protein
MWAYTDPKGMIPSSSSSSSSSLPKSEASDEGGDLPRVETWRWLTFLLRDYIQHHVTVVQDMLVSYCYGDIGMKEFGRKMLQVHLENISGHGL